MTEYEIDERVARFLAEIRELAGLKQTEMAKKLGVSRRTVQAWETGESFPKFSKLIQWIHITNQSPIRILQEIAAPVFDNIKGSDEDNRVEDALTNRVRSLRIREKRGLLFLLYGNHGSSVYAFLQLCVAYLHCPMGDRQNIAMQVINNYKNAKAMGRIVAPDNIEPDMQALEQALEKGREAYVKGQDSYFNIDFDVENL